jgi:hypothetical protein
MPPPPKKSLTALVTSSVIFGMISAKVLVGHVTSTYHQGQNVGQSTCQLEHDDYHRDCNSRDAAMTVLRQLRSYV